MRVVIAEFLQETNTFAPAACDIERFKQNRLVFGQDIPTAIKGRDMELNGFIDVLNEYKAAVIPSVSANSISGGVVESAVFDLVLATLTKDIQAASPIDGVLLAMHGAMVTQEYEDATGMFLQKIREAVGDGVVIGCTLDFHANITKKIIDNADIVVGYHTYPHIDLYATAEKAARLTLKTIKKELDPVMAFSKAPMILPAEACMTNAYPASQIASHIDSTEKETLSASAFIMQPWLNISDVGCSCIVITDNDEATARKLAQECAQMMWEIKDQFQVELVPLDQAFEAARQNKSGKPIIFADSSDSPSAGAPGSGNAILREIIEQCIDTKVLLNVVDGQTAYLAEQVGVGNTASFLIGAKTDTTFGQPVLTDGEVLFADKWACRFKGPMYTGKICPMGQTAVIKVRNSIVVVMEHPVDNCDPEIYRSLGHDPGNFDAVVVKSANGFKAPYEGMYQKAIIVDTPGASSAKIKELPFDRMSGPVYPFGDVHGFTATGITGKKRNRG